MCDKYFQNLTETSAFNMANSNISKRKNIALMAYVWSNFARAANHNTTYGNNSHLLSDGSGFGQRDRLLVHQRNAHHQHNVGVAQSENST